MKENEKRTVKKSFRFTNDEWYKIMEKCEKIDITPSEYFQQIATSGRVAKQDCLKEKKMYLSQISIIANCLNIIARQLSGNSYFDNAVLNILSSIELELKEKWLP